MTNSTITFVYLFGNWVFEAGIFRFVNMNMNLFGNSSTKGIFLLSSSIKSILVALIVLTKMLRWNSSNLRLCAVFVWTSFQNHQSASLLRQNALMYITFWSIKEVSGHLFPVINSSYDINMFEVFHFYLFIWGWLIYIRIMRHILLLWKRLRFSVFNFSFQLSNLVLSLKLSYNEISITYALSLKLSKMFRVKLPKASTLTKIFLFKTFFFHDLN